MTCVYRSGLGTDMSWEAMCDQIDDLTMNKAYVNFDLTTNYTTTLSVSATVGNRAPRAGEVRISKSSISLQRRRHANSRSVREDRSQMNFTLDFIYEFETVLNQ